MAEEHVKIAMDSIALNGDLSMPSSRKQARGSRLVIFAHGSGSSRLSPRNRFVASVLQEKGFATLLFDLLTEKEDQDYRMRFDIELLAERLEKASNWILRDRDFKHGVGYFGASTGAAAALIAAAELGSDVASSVVSRGGRVDMAGPYLKRVGVPTLLIVGERDQDVLELNRSALKELASQTKNLTIIPGATHLFEEPGALEEVAKHAAEWFEKFL